jgi:hypothetical protein
MAWRRLRARAAGALRPLRRLAAVAAVWRLPLAWLARGWRWLTGSGWDREDVAELYGEQTTRGYGAGLGDVIGHRESDPVRPQRVKRPDDDG